VLDSSRGIEIWLTPSFVITHLCPMPLAVHVKHAGKLYDVQLDTDQPPLAFKQAVYQLTGVPVDRMKVMIKGGVLKVRTLSIYSSTRCPGILLLLFGFSVPK
jgi:hypothetical protein